MMRSDRRQARSARVWRQGRLRPAGWLLAAALAGCGTPSLDPAIGWWHQLEGGTIAEQRPPPPGIGQPFPRVFTTPSRPTLPDAAARIALTDRLVAGRDAAERVGARDPLPAPGTAVAAALASAPPAAAAPAAATPAAATPAAATPTAAPAAAASAPGAPPAAGVSPVPGPAPARQPPGAPGLGALGPGAPASALPAAAPPPAAAAAPGAATGPSATFAAAEAPAAPPRTAPPRTPARAGAPAATPATPAELQALAKAAPASGAPLATMGADATGGPLPAIPAAPPPPPSFADVVPLPAATPPPPLPAAVPLAARGTAVRFLPGTATLATGQAGALHALAGQRAGGAMAAIGYGDSGADAPAAQAGALDLALRRAEAIAAVLGTYGVPASAIRVSAEAFGRGGAVRLLH